MKFAHKDWLRLFREDLRIGNIKSLSSNVALAGLEVLLDRDFEEIVRQEDARELAILIGTLGETNSKEVSYYKKLKASYQYLTSQLNIDCAARECSINNTKCEKYYYKLLELAGGKKKSINLNYTFTTEVDIEYGIELLINTGNSDLIFELLKSWQSIDKSDIPWLKTCRNLVKKGTKNKTIIEAKKLSNTCQQLIAISPKKQYLAKKEMLHQWAHFSYKSKDGNKACLSAKTAFEFDNNNESRFQFAKALVLNNKINEAITHLDAIIKTSINGMQVALNKNKENKKEEFNTTLAEKSLKNINSLLKEKDLKPFLISGTLLGYVRNGKLLPHDKDIDIGVVGWENQFSVAEALINSGQYKIDLSQLTGSNRYLIAAYDIYNDVATDIFIFHEQEDCFLHGIDFEMGFTQNFKFSKFDIIEVTFLGDVFYIPSNFEKNLEENYGTWKEKIENYIVTIESPSIEDKDSIIQLLITQVELLKTMLENLDIERINRIKNAIKKRRGDHWNSIRKSLELIEISLSNNSALSNKILSHL